MMHCCFQKPIHENVSATVAGRYNYLQLPGHTEQNQGYFANTNNQYISQFNYCLSKNDLDNVRIDLKLLMIISRPAVLGPSDPDAAESKDEGKDHLRSHICPEEEEEEEERLNTLTPHKSHQCHLTGT